MRTAAIVVGMVALMTSAAPPVVATPQVTVEYVATHEDPDHLVVFVGTNYGAALGGFSFEPKASTVTVTVDDRAAANGKTVWVTLAKYGQAPFFAGCVTVRSAKTFTGLTSGGSYEIEIGDTVAKNQTTPCSAVALEGTVTIVNAGMY